MLTPIQDYPKLLLPVAEMVQRDPTSEESAAAVKNLPKPYSHTTPSRDQRNFDNLWRLCIHIYDALVTIVSLGKLDPNAAAQFDRDVTTLQGFVRGK